MGTPQVISNRDELVERLSAWQCIGCGKLEMPQPCIGVCKDRKIELVSAVDYETAMKKLSDAKRDLQKLADFLQLFACTTPREGAMDRTYRALRERARQLLAEVAEPDA